MTKVFEISEKIESLAPLYLKEDFDNVGLLFGREDKEVKKVLLALDATEEVVNCAKEKGADMIICHHPFIFDPIKAITLKDGLGRSIMTLAKEDISVYSSHTNLDRAKGGLNDLFSKKLSLNPTEDLGDEKDGLGIGRISLCDTTLMEMVKKVKKALSLSSVRYAGKDAAIKKIAVCTGCGRSLVEACIEKECDLYITGELHHSEILRLLANNISYIEVTHFDSEIIVREIFKSL